MHIGVDFIRRYKELVSKGFSSFRTLDDNTDGKCKIMRFRHGCNTERLRSFRQKLLRWYEKHRRDLPWRINPTPYRVWISETMLQQTQARTVVPYFERFLEQFPNIDSLARASEKRILELWAGLGYYRRARNLHKAARQIVKTRRGFPQSYEDILALPGVGRYTAGAISSFAFNHAQPVVDGNIRRVLIRLNGIRTRIPESDYWNQMSALLPRGKASSFNQAMMELGALICTPTGPHCSQCPLPSFCRAFKWSIQESIPKTRRTGAPELLRLVILLLERDGKILLTSSDKPGIIPGKWGLPCRLATGGESSEEVAAMLCRIILKRDALLVRCSQFRHSITNHRILVHVFSTKGDLAIRALKEKDGFRWLRRSSGKKLLTSSLFRKALSDLESRK
jgi:A/G-specific adenine glycosylase